MRQQSCRVVCISNACHLHLSDLFSYPCSPLLRCLPPSCVSFTLKSLNPRPRRYFYPYQAPITQMIVLKAANPWGPKFGHIPAIIFVYLQGNGTAGETSSLNFAVCGNADYAYSYLYPDRYPLPPTMVTLQATYTNPLSEELPPR